MCSSHVVIFFLSILHERLQIYMYEDNLLIVHEDLKTKNLSDGKT